MSVGIVRRLAEIALSPLALKRRLPDAAGGGLVMVSAKVGGLKFLLKEPSEWDPELLTVAGALVKRGQSVWDLGANVGLFSKAAAYFAGTAGKVLSIEADMDAVALLNRTCRYRSPGHADMTVLPIAVSDSIGFVRFAIAERARAANSIEGFGSTQTGGIRETRTLPCATLDSLVEHFGTPDVLKIDVEGAELKVLRGARQVLSQARPSIYCEVIDQTRTEAVALLEAAKYALWDGSGFDGTSNCRSVSNATCNLVAIPQEKIEGFFASP